jgi:hypothetical protein
VDTKAAPLCIEESVRLGHLTVLAPVYEARVCQLDELLLRILVASGELVSGQRVGQTVYRGIQCRLWLWAEPASWDTFCSPPLGLKRLCSGLLLSRILCNSPEHGVQVRSHWGRTRLSKERRVAFTAHRDACCDRSLCSVLANSSRLWLRCSSGYRHRVALG